MKRFALLIEASEVPNEDKLPGAKADVANFREWICSKPGGAWFTTEIVELHTPTLSEVKKAITAAGKMDFAFVTFAGHGIHSQELDETKACLRDGRMVIRDLIPNVERCTIVVDACRNVVSERLLESIEFSLARQKYMKFAEDRNARRDFEVQVAKAEKGYEFLYSCGLNESAGDTPTGGFFSWYLVQGGNEFAQRNEGGKNWYSVKSAFNFAAKKTTERHRPQHPQFEPGRRTEHFPFAV
jgi:hypothetical protein